MSELECIILDSGVLRLLLQHETFAADPSVVLLMATASKATQAAVQQMCRGRVAVSFEPKNVHQVEQFAGWLVKHGQLLGALTVVEGAVLKRLRGKLDRSQLLRETDVSIAEALRQHTQRHGQLALGQLHHLIAVEEVGAIAQAVSPSTLTSLVVEPEYPHTFSLHNCKLSAFSKLQHLQLGRLTAQAFQLLTPAVPAMVGLRALELSGRISAAELATALLANLPNSLQTLRLAVFNMSGYEIGPMPLQLRHLRSLRSFRIVGSISNDSMLPQSLEDLCCNGCSSMQPLLSCMQLQNLEIHDNNPAAELFKLSLFTSLTRISLGIWEPTAADSLAIAFKHAPMNTAIRELELSAFRHGDLGANMIQQLRWLGGLTHLKLKNWVGRPPGTPAQMAGSLQHLTALQTLHLWPSTPFSCPYMKASPYAHHQEKLDRMEAGGWLPSNMRVLTRVIADLPRLRDLALSSTGLSMQAVEPLASMTQLSALQLWSPGFNDSALSRLACGLSGLKCLDVGLNGGITDSSILMLSHTLQQLTALTISGCPSITMAATTQLTRLRQLKHLAAFNMQD